MRKLMLQKIVTFQSISAGKNGSANTPAEAPDFKILVILSLKEEVTQV